MRFLKKIVMSMIIAMIPLTFASADKSIYMNNYKIKDTTLVAIKDERSYIYAKDLSVALGGVYNYDSKKKTATITTDKVEYGFENGSNLISVNGAKRSTAFRPYVEKGKMMVPLAMLKEVMKVNLYWNYKTENLFINSEEKVAKDKPKYELKKTTEILKKTMGEEANKYKFTYALTEDVKNEKFMVDGTYYVFRSNEKGVESNKVNGFFYLNIYTNDIYFYPVDARGKKDVIKYSGGKEVSDYVVNGKNATTQLIATTNMISDVKASDTSLGSFTYTRKTSIDKKYEKELPSGNYYYYQASKSVNGKLKPQFEVAQNSKTLEVYLFLKSGKGVSIIKLPDKTIVKTISKTNLTNKKS
ncbi:copper amine oxidase N-terminal domain protein [Peptostreptococcaceae bacterium AS15]|nr:copper amine oxidase N-terminal domain protein [Peptostreptococcaceae bacterium AS15]